MPSRIIREGFLDSEALFQAGELAEVLFTRLMLIADDYGRFDGRVAVICRRCWPLGGPTEVDVLERLCALTAAGLIVTYEVGGKPFICIPKFNQRLRIKNKSKYPDPPEVRTDDGHMPDMCPTLTDHPPDACSPEVNANAEVHVNANTSSKQRINVTTGDSASTFAAAGLEALKAPTLDESKISSEDETPAGMLAAVCIANGIRANPFHPLVRDWARDGVTMDRLKAAIATARQRKPAPENIPPAYLDTILRAPERPQSVPWKTDDEAAIAKGRELGIEPRRGEDFSHFRKRIGDAVAERARSQVQ